MVEVKESVLLTKCYFSNLRAITISELKMARKKVCIAVAWINFEVYYPTFSELLSRRVSVQIIVNNDSNNVRYKDQIDSLICLGARIIMINASGTMHHKFCIIDESRCLFGSYNWTTNAEFRNIEDLNICDEPQLVNSYLQEFIALRDLSEKDLKLLRNPAKCNTCRNPKMNILIFEQDGYYHTKIQKMELCGCGYHWYNPEYYDISVYINFNGIIEKYEKDIEDFYQYNDEKFLEKRKAEMDFEIAMYWSMVRKNRFGFEIIHAVGKPGSRMYGRHDEEHFYQMIWKERGMENFIPDEI
ncbi:MAG: phospholipase D-like domain-containing protein [Lachnospiraceae bacterium]|nr:phospholipase D-like domain-containing protein [Lachnospiraceae bacterium]